MNKTLIGFLIMFGVIFILVYVTNSLVSKELDNKPKVSAPQVSQPLKPVEDKAKVIQPPADRDETVSSQINNSSPDQTLTNQQIIYELPLEDKILVQ